MQLVVRVMNMLSTAVVGAFALRVGNDIVRVRLQVCNSASDCCLFLQFSKQLIFMSPHITK